MVTSEIEKNKRDQIAAFFAALGEVLFSLERPSYLCLPFRFDQEELAGAFGDEAPGDAMHPLRAVIGKIVESLPLFDKLIAKAEMQLPMRQG